MKKLLFLLSLINILGLASCGNKSIKDKVQVEIAEIKDEYQSADLEWDSDFTDCTEDEGVIYQVDTVLQDYALNLELPGCMQANKGVITVTKDAIYISSRNFSDEERDFPDVFIARNFDNYEIFGEGYDEFIESYNDSQLREYKFMAKPNKDYEVMTYVELNKQKLCPEFYTKLEGDSEWKEFTSVEDLCTPFTYGDITIFDDLPCHIKLYYGEHIVSINIAFPRF